MSHETRPTRRSATFSEVFASSEYRAVYTASVFSWVGDFLAKAAVTALVYSQTHSVTASAATFAISFLPWVVGGPVLAALAERYRHRTVMISCDVSRAVLVALIALPHLSLQVMLVLLFCTALLTPPFDAARSALLPRILEGDRYVVAVAVHNSTSQSAQLVGYMSGSALAAINPRLALLIDAGTFGLSALLVGFGVRDRAPLLAKVERTHLLQETVQGFRVVFGTPVLRAITITVLAVHLFTMPPEGLAAAWAGQLEQHNSQARGWAQAMIMMAGPLGYIVGSLTITRLVNPDLRRRLIRPFAILAPLTLVPALVSPPALVVAVLAALCGACLAGMIPASNGLYVQALLRQYRARANGVMQSGLQLVQGGTVMLTGALAAYFHSVAGVVGFWSLGGVLLMLIVSARWPAPSEFESTIERTQMANAAAEAADAADIPLPPGAPEPAGGSLSSPGMRTVESY